MYSKLDIINEMIVSTGARPLLAEQSNHPMYKKASELLTRIEKDVQSIGLWFNTEIREIEPQADGKILVPNDVMRADPTDRNYDLTLRKRKMWNLKTGAFYTGDALVLNMVFRVPLEELPVAAQEYIRAKAVYEFYLNEDGAGPKLDHYRNQRDIGWSKLYREHIRSRQANIHDNPENTTNRLRRGVKPTRTR